MEKKLRKAAGLWLLGVLAVLGVAWGAEGAQAINFPKGAKLAASLLMVFWAFWANRLLGRPGLMGRSTRYIAWGMFFGFLGDVTMQRIFFERHAVLVAIVIFGLGHLAYLFAFCNLMPRRPEEHVVRKAVAAGPIVGPLLWWGFIYEPTMPPVLFVGSLMYSLLIVAMAAGAFMLWRREPRYGLAFLGSLSFIVSDVLLGNQLFRSPAFAAVGLVIFATYILGQWAIVSAAPWAFKEPTPHRL